MAREICLPYNKPVYTYYTTISFPFAICQPKDWLYSQCFNWYAAYHRNCGISAYYGNKRIGILTGDSRGGMPFLSYEYLKKSDLDSQLYKEIFYECLSKKKYIFLDINFQGYSHDINSEYTHNVLLHGIDENNLYFLGYNMLSRDALSPYESNKMELGVDNLFSDSAGKEDVILLSQKDVKWSFCTDILKYQIRDYLDSSLTERYFKYYFSEGESEQTNTYFTYWHDKFFGQKMNGTFAYGLQVYEYFIDHIKEFWEKYEADKSSAYPDARIYKCMQEHKRMMADRWQYVQRKGYAKADLSPYIESAIEVRDDADCIFNKLIKQFLKREFSYESVCDIIQKLEKIRKIEENYLAELYDRL